MKTFKELYDSDELSEFRVISKAQRRKMGIRMKRMAKSAVHKMKVAKSKLRIASPAKQRVKAHKMAKKKILDKFYPKYKDMPLSQRVQIDQKIAAKHGALINKLSVKLLKVVKKKEVQKVKKARESKAKKNA